MVISDEDFFFLAHFLVDGLNCYGLVTVSNRRTHSFVCDHCVLQNIGLLLLVSASQVFLNKILRLVSTHCASEDLQKGHIY